jgi:Ran GTPase-activating protein (RanGAP) involved in mRNA processing and transport
MTGGRTILCPIKGPLPAPSCPPEELAPLLELLRTNEAVVEPRALPRGTLLPDGRLDLCKQSLGVEACKAVTSALTENTVVRSLLLGTNGIGDEGATAVADLLSVNRALEVIYLGCNGIGTKGAERLVAAIAENPTVSGLWLKRNPIGAGGLRAVANLVRGGAAVRTLDLVNVSPGEPGLCEVIAAVAEKRNAVECLYLGGNALDEKAAPALAELLGTNQNLRGLFLNVNCFGDAGARRLADGLARNRWLRALGLASNGFGPAGIAAIARALCGHPKLTWLDFGFSPSTRVLGCSANRVCGEATAALAELIAGTPHLTELNLAGTGIDGRDLESLARAAERNLAVMRVTYTGPRVAVLEELLAPRRVHHKWTRAVLPDVSLVRSVHR